MTDEQKYQELLKEVGEMMKSKNDKIFLLEYEVKTLTEKLERAEAELKKKGIEINE